MPEASREYTLKFAQLPAGVAPNGELRPRFALAGALRLTSLTGWVAINCVVPSSGLVVHSSPHCGIGHCPTCQISEA
jgi:hypothetical protein